jgi:hypothetical protein
MQVSLDMSDAMELQLLLGFLAGWMKADRDYLALSLARYLGVDVKDCCPDSLAADCSRFRFLLGATDGEGVSIPGRAVRRFRGRDAGRSTFAQAKLSG